MEMIYCCSMKDYIATLIGDVISAIIEEEYLDSNLDYDKLITDLCHIQDCLDVGCYDKDEDDI